MNIVRLTQHVVIIHTPRFGAEDKGWLQYRNNLIGQAGLLRLDHKIFDLGSILHDFKYFSEDDDIFYWIIVEEIGSKACARVWFTGDGMCEAARRLVQLACDYCRPVSYMGLKRQPLLAGYVAWHAPVFRTSGQARSASW